MKEIILKRTELAPTYTIGDFTFLDFKCNSLEDTVRINSPKIPGKTSIPAGRYKIIIDFSNRFQKLMPHILNVPNFEGIRIHSGNKAEDTEGCILLGIHTAPGFIFNSRETYNKFYTILEEVLQTEEVYINIS